jgi:TfoX/Sxy family transcriptional regulator of competence genes
MAYDERLAERIREVIQARPGVTERKMFGGLGFMLNGNMACGVMSDDERTLRGGSSGAPPAPPNCRQSSFSA